MSSFEHKKLVKRNIALDIIKVLGVILITNAHSWDLWDVINRRLAVGGAQGVTLFFFVSGFAMMIGSTRTKPFIDFVLDKIKRLWPPVILWAIISSAFFEKQIDWSSFFAIQFCYWFISCIFIYYVICYWFVNKTLRTKWKALWGGIALTCLIILTLSPTKHSIYVDYHYYMYIGSMFLGMIVGEYEQKGVLNIKNNFMSRFFFLMAGVVCLFLYFVIIAVCKGENNPYYLFQLSALLPLLLMPLFFYCAFRGSDITQVVVRHKWLNIPIVIVSQMSLEIYIVQFLIISDTYNFLFPFNFVINYVEVILAAYVLKVLSNVFLRIFHHTSDSYLHIFVI